MSLTRAFVEKDCLDGISWALNKIAVRDIDVLGSGDITMAAPAVLVGKLDNPHVKQIVREQKIAIGRKARLPDTINLRSLRDGSVLVTGDNDRALIYGILELPRHLHSSRISVTDSPSFHRRIYKHELVDSENGVSLREWHRGDWATVSDAFWEGLFQQLSECRYNGLVFWCYQPFEQWIWNEEFPEARTLKHSEWKRNAKRLRFIFSRAKQYGIELYFHFYVAHCSRPFARRHQLVDRGPAYHGGEDAPVIRRYTEYCIDKILCEYPQLDGIWLNMETLNDAYDFIEESIVVPMRRQQRPLKLFIRLWNAYFPERMAAFAAGIAGTNIALILPHKHHSDRYCRPRPDRRLKAWIDAVPDAEVLMMTGPCHTTAAAQLSSSIWVDPDFIRTLLHRAHRLGVRNVSFNTNLELFDKPDDDVAFHSNERIMARFNKPHAVLTGRWAWHLETATNDGMLAQYFKEEYDLKNGGENFYLALLQATSRIICLANLQFFHNAFYLKPKADNPYVQEPYAYDTASSFSDRPNESYQYTGGLLPARAIVDHACPRIIDHINGGRATNTPLTVIEELDKAAAASLTAGAQLAVHEPSFQNVRELKILLEARAMYAAFIAHNIRAGLALFALHKHADFAAFREGLDTGIAALRQAVTAAARFESCQTDLFGAVIQFGRGGVDAAGVETSLQEWTDLRAMLIRNKKAFPAFACYAASLNCYIRTRAQIRPFRIYTDELYDRRAGACIERARRMVEPRRSVKFISEWEHWLEAQQQKLSVKSMPCPSTGESRIEPLRLDDAFGRGMPLVQDYLAFFGQARNFPPSQEVIGFSLGYDDRSFFVDVRGESERGEDLYPAWDAQADLLASLYFIGININPHADGRQVYQLWLAPSELWRYFHIQYDLERGLFRRALPDDVGITVVVERLGNGHWSTRIEIPFAALDARPTPGAEWDFNIHCTPALMSDDYAWNATFEDWRRGNPRRLGKISFE